VPRVAGRRGISSGDMNLRRCSPRREPPITVGLWRLTRLALPNICATHWTGVGAM
jgi:hypothetical protein